MNVAFLSSPVKWRLADHVDEWLKLGATWIGGCCHIYGEDIAEMRQALEQRSDVQLLDRSEQLL